MHRSPCATPSPQSFDEPRAFLGGSSPAQFLSNHWQKAPLLCRAAVPIEQLQVGPSTLLELATQPDVESRVVRQRNDTWELHPGPLASEALDRLGKQNWTVLVSDLDEHLPALQPLLAHLDFLPRWRLDDIMGSVAVEGGSVGPHYDSYDVFLVQARGTRTWQISEQFDRRDLLDDCDLCILRDFRPQRDWELQPGDVLYLPPHVAHYGVATSDDCITLSLGARAPSSKELLTHIASELIDAVSGDEHFCDPDRSAPPNAAQLQSTDVDFAHELFTRHLTPDRGRFVRAFGSLVSEPKALFADVAEPINGSESHRIVCSARGFVHCKGSRWLWWQDADEHYLFVNGHCFECSGVAPEFIDTLCRERRLSSEALERWKRNEAHEALLRDLVEHGLLVSRN